MGKSLATTGRMATLKLVVVVFVVFVATTRRNYFLHGGQSAWVWRMSRLARDGTAEPVSRDQILRHVRGQGNIIFPCSADHEQDWQPHPVDPYSGILWPYIHTHIHNTYNDSVRGMLFASHIQRTVVLVANPKKLLYTVVANPARGLFFFFFF